VRAVIIRFVSRLRRLIWSGRSFSLTCRVHRSRGKLSESDFADLAREPRDAHRFLVTAGVFLADVWHAILAVDRLPLPAEERGYNPTRRPQRFWKRNFALAGGAIVRGLFCRVRIDGRGGTYGPHRLIKKGGLADGRSFLG
jgi:hypothetical protein